MKHNTCSHCCLKIENLFVHYGDDVILEDIHLHVNCNEFIAVTGPNGAGKTTLLKAILNEIPYTGTLHYRIQGSLHKKPIIGYVPQKLYFDLDSPVSVADFVGISISRRPIWLGLGQRLNQHIQDMLTKFDILPLINKRIGDLSGGELQKVLLAIAMTPTPNLLLLDEPDAGVDARGLLRFYQHIIDIKKEYDISIIMVTHDLEGVSAYADHVVSLNKRILSKKDLRIKKEFSHV